MGGYIRDSNMFTGIRGDFSGDFIWRLTKSWIVFVFVSENSRKLEISKERIWEVTPGL